MRARWEGNYSLFLLPARPRADHQSILPEDVETMQIMLSPLRPDAFHLSGLLLPLQRGWRLSMDRLGSLESHQRNWEVPGWYRITAMSRSAGFGKDRLHTALRSVGTIGHDDLGGSKCKSCWSPTSEVWWPCRAFTGQQETESFIHGNTSNELNLSPHQAAQGLEQIPHPGKGIK